MRSSIKLARCVHSPQPAPPTDDEVIAWARRTAADPSVDPTVRKILTVLAIEAEMEAAL